MGERQFPAVILEVHDGDTLTVLCDLGFDCWRNTVVRIKGIAARELDAVGGREAKAYLFNLLPQVPIDEVNGFKSTCILYAYKWDKYAPRVQGDIQLYNGRRVSELMVESGYAVLWDGKGVQPTPNWPIPQEVRQQTLFVP